MLSVLLNTSSCLLIHSGRQEDGWEFKTQSKILDQCNWMAIVKDNHKSSESRPLKFSPITMCISQGCSKRFKCWLLQSIAMLRIALFIWKDCVSLSQWSIRVSVADSFSGQRLFAFYFLCTGIWYGNLAVSFLENNKSF